MRVKALYTILSQKLRDNEVLFVDSITLSQPKTKEAVKTLESLSSIKGFEKLFSKRKNATIVAFSSKDKKTERAFNNLGNIKMLETRNLDPISLLEYKYLVIENPQKAFVVLPGMSQKSHE